MRMMNALIGYTMCVTASSMLIPSAYASELGYSPLAFNSVPAAMTPVESRPLMASSAPAETAPMVTNTTPVTSSESQTESTSSPVVTSPPPPITSTSTSTGSPPPPITSTSAGSPPPPITSTSTSAGSPPPPITSTSTPTPSSLKPLPEAVPVSARHPIEVVPASSSPAVVTSPPPPIPQQLNPKSSVAVPRSFATRPSIAMVSPLGLKIYSSPNGFSLKSHPAGEKTVDGKPPTGVIVGQPPSGKPQTITSPPPPLPSKTVVATDTVSVDEGASTITDEKIAASNQEVTRIEEEILKGGTTPDWTYVSRRDSSILKTDTYCPLLTVSLGFAHSSNLGTSTYYAAGRSGTTSFYNFLDNTSASSQPVAGVFAGAEFVLHPSLSMQAGLGYYQSGAFSARGRVTQGVSNATASTYNYTYNVSSQRYLIETKFLYNRRRFHPYVSAGVGASLNKAGGWQVAVTPRTTSYVFGTNTAGSITYSIGLGFDIDFATNIRMGLGYRFSDYGRYKLGRGVIGPVVTTNDIGQSHLYMNEFLAQFTVFM